MTQFRYFHSITVFDPHMQREIPVDISQSTVYEDQPVRIVDNLEGNVTIVSQVNALGSANPEYIILDKNYYLVDGPYRERTTAERLLNS